MFLEILQNSQGNTYATVSFLIKLQAKAARIAAFSSLLFSQNFSIIDIWIRLNTLGSKYAWDITTHKIQLCNHTLLNQNATLKLTFQPNPAYTIKFIKKAKSIPNLDKNDYWFRKLGRFKYV